MIRIRLDPSLSLGAEGQLTRLTFPPKEHGHSWKLIHAFRGGEATRNHPYREKGQYDMIVPAGGSHGRSDGVVVDLDLASRDHAKHRRCLSVSLPRLISSSRDRVELPALPPAASTARRQASSACWHSTSRSPFLSPVVQWLCASHSLGCTST